MTTPPGISFPEAQQEIEQIVRELESGRLDVDTVVEKVKRVEELIKLCRARIQEADIQIRTILGETVPS